jgi:hypothetical protein
MDNQDELYKIVTLKNVDNEDFVFSVDKVPYLFKAGEVRNFPKFMANLAVKHLIDKILEKRDKEGKLMTNPKEREALASQIVVGEEQYDRPHVPSTQEIVEQINQPSDIDTALARNRDRLKTETPVVSLPTPDLSTISVPVIPVSSTLPIKEVITPDNKTTEGLKTGSDNQEGHVASSETEEFEGLKSPARDEMLAYAKNILKLDIEDKKTKAAFAKMTDEELFKELQMEK